MKLWLVVPALLFVTLTLHAQSRFYTDPCDPLYYSGAYPPYCFQSYYPQVSFTANTLLMLNHDEAINALTRQVEQLSEQVRELSAEIALVKTQQPQPRPSPSEAIAPPALAPAPPITFILRNGT